MSLIDLRTWQNSSAKKTANCGKLFRQMIRSRLSDDAVVTNVGKPDVFTSLGNSTLRLQRTSTWEN